jgi:hypothetical protein
VDARLQKIFLGQIELQCRAVLLANETLAAHLKDPGVAFCAIQSLLNAAANLAKCLWGTGGQLSAERAPLRARLEVGDTSPLKNVTMRNNFEHFDERLDTWWATSEKRNYFDRNVWPGRPNGFDDNDVFRVFTPGTGQVWFWGNRSI